jgi:hypothetical protein
MHIEAKNTSNAKVGALRVVQEGYKAIAGMFGVSTAKIALDQSVEVEHSGSVELSGDKLGEVLEVLAECGALTPGAAEDAAASDDEIHSAHTDI